MLAYAIKFLLTSQVVLVDHVVIVNIPSPPVAVIILPVAANVFGLVMVIVGAVLSFLYV